MLASGTYDNATRDTTISTRSVTGPIRQNIFEVVASSEELLDESRQHQRQPKTDGTAEMSASNSSGIVNSSSNAIGVKPSSLPVNPDVSVVLQVLDINDVANLLRALHKPPASTTRIVHS